LKLAGASVGARWRVFAPEIRELRGPGKSNPASYMYEYVRRTVVAQHGTPLEWPYPEQASRQQRCQVSPIFQRRKAFCFRAGSMQAWQATADREEGSPQRRKLVAFTSAAEPACSAVTSLLHSENNLVASLQECQNLYFHLHEVATVVVSCAQLQSSVVQTA
jgi:hypothetical protein